MHLFTRGTVFMWNLRRHIISSDFVNVDTLVDKAAILNIYHLCEIPRMPESLKKRIYQK